MTRNTARPATTRRRAARRPTTGFRRLTVEVLEGRDLPSFITAPEYTAGALPYPVAVADLTGDGQADLVVANDTTAGTVSVLTNQRDGTFAAALSYAVGVKPRSVAVGDVDGDQHLDLVVANWDSHTVSVLLNQGDGTFTAAVSY